MTGSTVNSRYCDTLLYRDLVSVLARVRNSGVREKNHLRKEIDEQGIICIQVLTRAITRGIVIDIYKQNPKQNSIQRNITYKRLCVVPRNLPYQSSWFPTIRYRTKRFILTRLFLFRQAPNFRSLSFIRRVKTIKLCRRD